jgi:hypothetical protein
MSGKRTISKQQTNPFWAGVSSFEDHTLLTGHQSCVTKRKNDMRKKKLRVRIGGGTGGNDDEEAARDPEGRKGAGGE